MINFDFRQSWIFIDPDDLHHEDDIKDDVVFYVPNDFAIVHVVEASGRLVLSWH